MPVNCQKLIRCWDNGVRVCQRPDGHKNGCNPFSATDPTSHKNDGPEKSVIETSITLFNQVLAVAGVTTGKIT